MLEGSSSSSVRVRALKLALGPVLAAVVLVLQPGDDPRIARMAAVAVWMAAWWVTEAVPIPVTALLPLVLMPLGGVDAMRSVAPNYGRPTIFLFLGGFLLALALQASGVHRRMALFIVHKVGGQPRRIVLGFMLASAFLSMWISNTATVMVLMPIGFSVLTAVRDRGVEEAALKKLGVAVMLAIAYAADIGGMATLVGTPPNLSYKEQLVRLFPEAPPPAFASWMMLGLPIAVVFLTVGWLILTRVVFRLADASLLGSREAVGEMRRALGPMRRDEWVTAGAFALTALLWMTRKDVELGALTPSGVELGRVVGRRLRRRRGRGRHHGGRALPGAVGGSARRAAARVVDGQGGPVGHAAPLRRRLRAGRRLQELGPLRVDGGPVRRARGRPAGRRHDPRVRRAHVPHGAHEQHGHHRDGPARPRERRRRAGHGPALPDDPRHALGELRVHDARGLAHAGDRLRIRLGAHPRHGARGHLVQPDRGPAGCARGSPCSAARPWASTPASCRNGHVSRLAGARVAGSGR